MSEERVVHLRTRGPDPRDVEVWMRQPPAPGWVLSLASRPGRTHAMEIVVSAHAAAARAVRAFPVQRETVVRQPGVRRRGHDRDAPVFAQTNAVYRHAMPWRIRLL